MIPLHPQRRPPGRSILFLLLLLVAALASACATGTPATRWPHEASDLPPDPALRFGRLDNGLRYALMANRTPRDRVSLHLDVRVGSLHEAENERGLAHFLEHMLFNGSTHFPPGELVKYFQRIGMEFGDDANAHTGFDETVYDVLLPDNDAESLAEGLLVLYDYAQGALLLEEEVDREREVVLAEMRTRDSPGYRTFKATLGFEFEGLRVTERLPIGLKSVLRATDRKRLKHFYDTWYRPERMILVAVGDFDPERTEKMIQRRFADLAPRAPRRAEPEMGRLDHRGLRTFYHPEPELGHVTVAIEQTRTRPPEPDSAALQRRLVAEHMADRILDQRLQRLLSRPDAPFTEAGADSGTFLGRLPYAELRARTDADRWADALTRLEQTLRQALTHGFTSGEVDRVRRELLAELDKAVAQAATRQSPELARRLIRHLNADRVMMSPSQERELLAPMIAVLTPAELHATLRRTWGADHRLVLVTGSLDLSGAAPSPEARIGAVYRKSAAAAVLPWNAEPDTPFPYLPPAAGEAGILRRIVHEDLGVVQILLDNQVRLSLKPTDFKDNEILVGLDLGPGRAAEPAGKPGLAELTEAVLNESGLGGLTRDALDRALAGRNTAVTFEMAEDRLRLLGETVSGELGLLFELLRHHLIDPGLRPAAYDLVMARMAQEYDDLAHSVDGQTLLHGRRFLAGGDSRFGLPSWEVMRALTLEDVRRWAGPMLAAAPLEVSVVGDFDPDRAVALARRILGGLPPRGPAVATETDRPGPHFPAGERREVTVDTQLDKGLVVVAFGTDDIWDIDRTRRLGQLGRIFSDRLREEIRERLGASYSPFAFHRPSRAYDGYGTLQAFVQVNPDQAAAVAAAVADIAADLAANGVNDDEFRRTREPTLTSIRDMLRRNEYWLDTVLSGAWRHPEQLDWRRTILDGYAAIRSEEIEVMARRYLAAERAAIFVVVPAAGATAGR